MFQSSRLYGAESEESGKEEEMEREAENHCRHCKGVINVGTLHIPLKKLLRFQQIQRLCSSQDEIRLVTKIISSNLTLTASSAHSLLLYTPPSGVDPVGCIGCTCTPP